MIMIGLIYFVVILVSCIFAAIVGLGGGILFRPVLDALGHHDFNNIQFLSSCAIIVMALVSTFKKMKDGSKIDIPVVISISLGAVLGGILGDWVLDYLLALMRSERDLQIVQTLTTIVVLGAAIFLTVKKDVRIEIKNKFFPPLMGFVLGVVAVFLGIGGGPLNVPLFMIFLGLKPKEATAYSIVVIFFTHTARLVRTGITSSFFYGFDLGILPIVALAAAVGGLLGAKASKKLKEETVKNMFIGAIVLVIVLNTFNGLSWIIGG
ncbi:MAG: sulfite exporter TauE/SafE family protein [Oscillospiraceae bacterium]|nr:sulfite exporter TauE/SafE family protein [Oscillospiraceae bacterium]MCL2279401.1 sulfite exporter TauE/SafE family protein [Oscillospiraceae bacterium]